ncbi:hypothetical protein ACTXMK_10125 [Psychrobacter celer]|uniref:hypothetical protein n=1 Tax=Psychrobacter celer TaxID=306572 RepID=UPI003FCFC4E3
MEEGCLNDVLFNGDDTLCDSENCPMTLADLTKKDFDQVIFLRKYQYDLSKTCGDMKISWLERSRFSEHCDYLIFSEGSKMTDFVRCGCDSNSAMLSAIENNIYFSDKEDRRLLNRVFEGSQKVNLQNNDLKGIKIDANSEGKITDFACFTEFERGAL